MIIKITDLHQNGIDVYTSLTEAQLRNKKETSEGIFIAESPNVIKRALEDGYKPISFLMEERHVTGDAEDIIKRCPDVPVYTGNSEILKMLTGFELSRGVLCAMHRRPLPTIEEICKNAGRIAVLEDITESTNVGAIFRSAAALNIDAVLVTPACCDPLCRRSARVSMGTVFQVPWTRIGTRVEDWPHPGIDILKSFGFKTAAMALTDNSITIDDKILCAENKLAIVLGTEGDGLSEHTIASCDYVVRIPMFHNVDSLNVAAAGAVAFWQLMKK